VHIEKEKMKMKELNGGLWLSKEDLTEIADWIRGEDNVIHNMNSLNQTAYHLNKNERRDLQIHRIPTIAQMLESKPESLVARFFDHIKRGCTGIVAKFPNVRRKIVGGSVGARPHKTHSSGKTF